LLPQLTKAVVHDVVFDLFPRHLCPQPSAARSIVEELRAFFAFVEREQQLPAAAEWRASLDKAAERKLRRIITERARFDPTPQTVQTVRRRRHVGASGGRRRETGKTT